MIIFVKKNIVMDTLIIHTEAKKTKALISFLKAFDISFEIKKDTKKEDKPYDPEFVKKVLATKNEKSIRVNPKNIWESIM